MAAAYTEKSNVVLTGKEPFTLDVTGAAKFNTAVGVSSGGTGATSLTGYVKGSGANAFTGSATVPGSDVSGNIGGNAVNVTGVVVVANGGSGATSLTGYLKGNGTSAFTGSATVPGSDVSGNIAGNAANVTGVVAVANGGTGATNAASALTNLSAASSTHGHGNITNAGAIGSTANLPIITTASGVLAAGSFGTEASTFCQGNDSRLSNARTPTSHVLATSSGLGGEHTVSGLAAGQVLKAKGATTAQFEAVAFSEVTGTASVAQGGTGATTLTGYVKGSGTNAMTASATIPGSDVSGNIAGNAANVTGVVAVANGGTGATNATSALTNLGAASSTHVHGNITIAGAIGSTANLPIITTASGVLAAGSFGTAANTFCQGNDSRLSDTRTPTSHIHGNITNAGAIGSAANLPIITTASGVLAAGSFGTEASTFCQGNDSRLSNARTPTSHVLATSSGLGGEHTVSGLAAGQVLKAKSATTAQFEAVAFSEVSGTASVSQGGSGATTLTGYLKGSGTSAFTGSATVPGSDVSGNIAGNAANVTGTVAVANGGTGTTTGSITGTGALTFTAGGTNTNVSLAPNGTGTVDVSSKRITNLATPTQDTDAATKAYVDAVKQGLDVKDSVRAATTANITLSGTQTIDGVAVLAADRVLVKNQSTGSQNGIYVAAAGSWTRAADADASSEVTAGMFTFVAEGTENADTGWILTTNDAITLGTTSLSFSQFSGAGQIVAGAGLTKNGTTIDAVGTADRITVAADSIDIASTYVGQTTITTLGTVATGTWNASTISVGKGGSGATTLTGYLKGNGTSAFTGSATVPGSDVSGNISGNAANVTGVVAVANGGTGATTASGARTNLEVPYTFGTGGTSIVAWQAGNNVASGDFSVVNGGRQNTASSSDSTVGGGQQNTSSDGGSTVGGGLFNTSSGYRSTVGGGSSNRSSGINSTVGGGLQNTSSGGYASTVGGGRDNTSSSYYSTVGGGRRNSSIGNSSTVGGGRYNAATGEYSAVGGGRYNTSSGHYSAVGGGALNTTQGKYGFVGAGSKNFAAVWSSVGGGYYNTASGLYSTVGGGRSNNATGLYGFVGGGLSNTASGYHSVVGGGESNTANYSHATVGGGYKNTVVGYGGTTISGGVLNASSGTAGFIGGGWGNTSNEAYTSIVGGDYNRILTGGTYGVVGGGSQNTIDEYAAVVGGGLNNFNGGKYGFVGGGWKNTVDVGLGAIAGGLYNFVDGARSFIGGGQLNTVYNAAKYGFVGGGLSNTTSSGTYAVIGGGKQNTAGGPYGFIGSGQSNTTAGKYGFVGAGKSNTASGKYASIPGGTSNTATHQNVFLLGSSLVSDAADTTYVENLRVKGGFNTGVTLGTNAFPTGKVSIRSAIVNLKTVAETTIFTVPTGYMFLIDTIEVVTTVVTGAAAAPTVQFGNTGDSDAYYGPTQITSNAVGARHISENPQDGAVAGTVITMGITAASTATTHSGVGIVTGYLLKTS